VKPSRNDNKQKADNGKAAGRGPRMIPVDSIDEYIFRFPREIQRQLQAVRRTIHKAAPKAEEAIRWRMPTFCQHGNLVHFAAFKDHISLFPGSSGIAAFQNELRGYVTSKGTVHFPHGEPIPHRLIAKIVKFRVQESMAKAAAKKQK
jgi:uncharacterized protein YdhG (YjbR/CyaY superfamily)